ncbi:MAG: hypothetical protein HY039_03705 [Nitrospirae bacterium]|nr:hypothetical protein [Nitrospirota bacterium]
MKTADVLRRLNIPRHKLYYLEQKGYIHPVRVSMGDLEARRYSDRDVMMAEAVWKYLCLGFRHKVAYVKAMEEIEEIDDHSRPRGDRVSSLSPALARRG